MAKIQMAKKYCPEIVAGNPSIGGAKR